MLDKKGKKLLKKLEDLASFNCLKTSEAIEKLKTKPELVAYQLEWSDTLFNAAAFAAVASKYVRELTSMDSSNEQHDFYKIKEHIIKETLQKASSLQQSTSVTSNYVALLRSAATAEVAVLVMQLDKYGNII
jgi:hypothetical protein